MTEIIPVLNCTDAESAEKRLLAIHTIGAPWLHVDVADGVFAPVKTWGGAHALQTILKKHKLQHVRLEVHLMVRDVAEAMEGWMIPEVGRIIVHVESLGQYSSEDVRKICEGGSGAKEVGIAVLPGTPIEAVLPYVKEDGAEQKLRVKLVQILTVNPGFSGQIFQEECYKKIMRLHEEAPIVTIEIDGGVTPDVVARGKALGATLFTSSSYLFNGSDPKKAYQTLSA